MVLERHLVERVDAAHPRDARGATLVVVPSTRVVEHVQQRLAAVRRAWLGLEVLHFRALARSILSAAGRTVPRVLPPAVQQTLLHEILCERPRNAWSELVQQRPAAARRVLSALQELREAGIAPADVRAAAGRRPRAEALAELYEAWVARLGGLRDRGFVDEAELVRRAAIDATAFAERRAAIFLHGAYELIGIHLDLVRALDAGREVVVLLPGSPGAPAAAYALDYARAHFAAEIEPLAAPASRAPRLALDALFDEEREVGESPLLRFRHAQGRSMEVGAALRAALGDVAEGCPPHEIAIVARALDPFAAALEAEMDALAIPWTSSLVAPARREPVVRDVLALLEVLARGFPRRRTAELLGSPRIRWGRLAGGGSFPGGQAEVWSRRAGLLDGLDEWTRVLPEWAAHVHSRGEESDEEQRAAVEDAARRAAAARRLGAALEALERRVEPHLPRSWSGFAALFDALLDDLVVVGERPGAIAAAGALRQRLDEMRLLDSLAAVTPATVSLEDARTWLEAALDGADLPLHTADAGGLRVLDAMELRGRTFRRVHFLGWNSGLLPRAPAEDAVLDDALREALARRTEQPLPRKADSAAEERLLLALALGSATERVDVSWQRADDTGRAQTPSILLREAARLAFGTPDVDRLRREARHLRSHPAQWLEDVASDPGLLRPDEEVLLLAFRLHGPVAAEALLARRPDLADGLDLLRETESFDTGPLAYDGRVGPLDWTDGLSVSALEVLGRCPLQFFFKHVLGVREPDDEADPFGVAVNERGFAIHEALESVYQTLLREGRFSGEREALLERARALVRGLGAGVLGLHGRRIGERLPVLGGHQSGRWIEALERFVEQDLGRLHDGRWRPVALESRREAELAIGGAGRLRVRGRIDREVERDDERRVGDYKTAGKLAKRVDVTTMLRGATLQVPLYWRLAGEPSAIELLGVGPDYDVLSEEALQRFEGFADPQETQGFEETLGTLHALLEGGSFPLHDEHHCEWCPYEQACRRKHPPTQEREAESGDAIDYRLTLEKTRRLATLSDVRGAKEGRR